MRKARKKHRERVAGFLQSLGMTDDEDNDSCDEKDDNVNSTSEDHPPSKSNSNSKNHGAGKADPNGDSTVKLNNGQKKSKAMNENNVNNTANSKDAKPNEPNHNKHENTKRNQTDLSPAVDMFDYISVFHDELHKGNLTALQQVKVKIVDFGNACYVVSLSKSSALCCSGCDEPWH